MLSCLRGIFRVCFAAGVVVIAKTVAQGVFVVGGCRSGNVRYSLEFFTSGAVKVLCEACGEG